MPVLYHHDGQGDLVLVGTIGRARFTLEFGRSRFEPIERWRAQTEATWSDIPDLQAKLLAEIDDCMASLLKAIDEAEAYRAKWGEPLNAGAGRLGR